MHSPRRPGDYRTVCRCRVLIIYICICICSCARTCTWIPTDVHTHIHTYIHTFISTHACIHNHSFVHAYIHAYILACIHTYCICLYTHMLCICITYMYHVGITRTCTHRTPTTIDMYAHGVHKMHTDTYSSVCSLALVGRFASNT